MTCEELIDLLYEAYYSCRKNKGRKPSAVQFGWNYEREIEQLAHELLNASYRPTTSIRFGVTRPKDREVFAANFRDRVVHHLLMNKFGKLLDAEMIDDSFNCRKEKGAFRAVKKLEDEIKRISRNYTVPTYVLSGDVEGFFNSIDKAKLWQMIERTIRDKYIGDDIEWWLRLFKIVMMHRPELDCVIRGDKKVLDRLPDNKTIARGDGTHGVPIGNLPSQICGNFYRTPFDVMMKEELGPEGFYCVFVDDFRAVSTDKHLLERLAVKARRFLKDYLGLNMHRRKFSVTEVRKGVSFVGAVIKPWGVYTGNRTVNNAFEVFCKDTKNVNRQLQRYNSYMGYLIHSLSYGIRWKLYLSLPARIDKEIVCINMKKIALRDGLDNIHAEAASWQNG